MRISLRTKGPNENYPTLVYPCSYTSNFFYKKKKKLLPMFHFMFNSLSKSQKKKTIASNVDFLNFQMPYKEFDLV
jgi:hypothetical protein